VPGRVDGDGTYAQIRLPMGEQAGAKRAVFSRWQVRVGLFWLYGLLVVTGVKGLTGGWVRFAGLGVVVLGQVSVRQGPAPTVARPWRSPGPKVVSPEFDGAISSLGSWT
jgi:hypothetical protein